MFILVTTVALFACNKENPRPPIAKYKKSTIRSEVPVNLKGIKTAQFAYEGGFDVFIEADPYPPISSGMTLKKWDPVQAGGFSVIAWEPDSDVRGTYWITTTTTDFTAYGIIDIDGDGNFATYKATKSENPNSPITPPDVY